MKTKNLLVALSVAMLSTSATHAQRVEADLVDGHPVINCEGMPSKAYTTIPKGRTEAELKTENADKELFKRFAVSKVDNHQGQSWAEAFGTCSNLGDGWRLPTKRELMLIWVLKRELLVKSDFNKFTVDHYWTATDNGSDKSLYMYFENGTSDAEVKTKTYRVRCIKELSVTTTKASPKKVKELPKASK